MLMASFPVMLSTNSALVILNATSSLKEGLSERGTGLDSILSSKSTAHTTEVDG